MYLPSKCSIFSGIIPIVHLARLAQSIKQPVGFKNKREVVTPTIPISGNIHSAPFFHFFKRLPSSLPPL